MKVVIGKGDLFELNKDLIKNVIGYDMCQLFIGVEGILGFVVEVIMCLECMLKNFIVMVFGMFDFDLIMLVLYVFQSKFDLIVFEFFFDKVLVKVLVCGDVLWVFEIDCLFYVLLEFEVIIEEVVNEVLVIFEYCVEQGWVLDGVMSQSEQQLQNLWKLCEYIFEIIFYWMLYKNDILVMVFWVFVFFKDIDVIVEVNYLDFEVVWFGYIGDGNLYLNIFKLENFGKDEFFVRCVIVNKWVFEIVEKYNGLIFVEYGVGMIKCDYLIYICLEIEIVYMKVLKVVFDFNGIMNFGKIFVEQQVL